MTEQIEKKQPERIKVNSSLVRRPLFMGVDMEFIFAICIVIWFSFLTFKLSLPLLIVGGLCLGAFQAMRKANEQDPYFLPILLRSLLYRKVYAARSGPLEQGSARPSIPKRAVQA